LNLNLRRNILIKCKLCLEINKIMHYRILYIKRWPGFAGWQFRFAPLQLIRPGITMVLPFNKPENPISATLAALIMYGLVSNFVPIISFLSKNSVLVGPGHNTVKVTP
jgi:hypothetical protein